MKQGLAGLTAQIGANNRIQQTNPQFLDIGNVVGTYYQGRDFATRQKILRDKMAEDESKNQYLENFRTAAESGDQTAMDKAYAQYDPSGYNNLKAEERKLGKQQQWEREKLALEQDSLSRRVHLENTLKKQDAYGTEMQKQNAKIDAGKIASEKMVPALDGALKRAEKAADSGNGLGIIGGSMATIGINGTDNAGNNLADVESANTQMNTFLRQKLASVGLTGSELNSAVEAQAYRYTISPRDDEDVIRRKIKNFRTDIIGEKPSVKIKAPDGKVFIVPAEQVEDALANGGERYE